ncbi:DUF1566 domain-containing protein [bacterium]|nr:DUF1566 domain-containing protein [bacterium]
MKKPIIFLILMVFIVSCGGSKKANDTDLLPDEDVTDADENDESTGPSFVNICTGLTKCYDNGKEIKCPAEGKDFYGQDVNYAKLKKCVPRKFSIDSSVKNEPLVIDKSTGLKWSQRFFEAENSAEASDYCENLNYGGHDDWRTPTFKELFSIIDWSRHDPAINTDYFPETPSDNFLASSVTKDYVWIVNFSKGVTRPTQNVNDKIYVRCVRGNDSFWKVEILSDYGGPEIFYINYPNINKKSEIFLEEYNNNVSTWEEALNLCNNKTLDGISNWRLPNINELAFFLFHIGGGKNSFYWSSTTYAEDPSGTLVFKFDLNGAPSISAEFKNSSEKLYVVCVADAPCENGLAWTGTECVNFCKPNPCKSMEHSNGKCELSFNSKLDKDSFTCGCNEEDDAFWNFWQEKCVTPCEPNPCENYKHSDGVCTIHKELPTYPDNIQEYSYYCGCEEPYHWVDRQIGCVNGCIPNHCENEEHSTGGCNPGDLGSYSCDCEEGYEWDWTGGCVSL